MRKFLVKHLSYPLHELAKGQKTVHAFGEACERDWWSVGRLEKFQLDGLRRILSLAYERAPFYKDHFRSRGVSPNDLKKVEDIRLFPFLTKDHIRASREVMVTVSPTRRSLLVPFSTGGSTGEPVKFFVDRERIASEWAACWRARSWWDLDWGDPWIWLWGSPIELSAGDRLKATVKKVRDHLLNRRLLSAFDMSERTMSRYAELIRRKRPRYIYAYSSAAYFLARFILENKLDLSSSVPQVVFTTADTLYPEMRQAITAAFHCPVSVEYGSREGGFIAHECPRGRLHIHADRVYLEIVDGEQSVARSELGEIVLTSLDATAMPFIRYRTGDLGALDPDPCPCGRVFPVLKSVEGRSSDFLLARGNKLIHGESISHVVRQIDGIAQFRVLQEDVDSLSVEIVTANAAAELPVDKMRAQIRYLFGYPVNVEIRRVQSLPRTASGKYRVVVSKLTGRYFETLTSYKSPGALS